MSGKDILDQWFPRSATPTMPAVRSWRDRLADGEQRKPTGERRKSNNIGMIAERWAAATLPGVIGATLQKSQTQHVEKPDADFWLSTDVDFVGSLPIVGGRVFPIHVEVKGCTDSLQLSRITKNERRYLDRAVKKSEGALLLIVWLPEKEPPYRQSDVIEADLVAWRRWLVIEADLAARADGRFKGRSLRLSDRDLLTDCGIIRADRRWSLCAGHWIASMIAHTAQLAAPF